jgi:hypothetical protein
VDLSEEELVRYDENDLFARPPSETNHLERVLRYEPRWPDGVMALAFAYSQQALSERRFSARLMEAAQACRKAAHELRPGWGPRASAVLFDHGVTAERRPQVRRLVHEPVGREPQVRARQQVAVDLPARPTSQAGTDERDRARTLLQAARRMRNRANELLSSARRREQKAERFVRQLLPHEWLWSRDGDELDLSLLSRADLVRRRDWERRLDDLHARALLVWSSLRLERAMREEVEEAADQSRRRFARLRPSRDDARRLRPADIFPALELCRRHFWPDDLYLLRYFASTDWLDEGQRADCSDALTRATRNVFERDPAYWKLWYLDDDAPDLVEVLQSAAEQRGIGSYLHVWLGWRLDRLKHPELALVAYENARESKDPELLLDLAEKLAEGGHWEERWRVLRRAMAAERSSSGERLRPEDFYRREIGRSLWYVGRLDDAVASFAQVSGLHEDPEEAWRTVLVGEVAQAEQASKETYRLLKRWLGHDLTRAQVHDRAAMRRDAAGALLLLTRRWSQQLIHRSRDVTQLMFEAPAATPPIIVEADAAFFPSGREGDAARRLADEELPAMQAELERQTGVETPTTWIRPVSGLGEARYRLYVNDELLVDDTLSDDQSDFAVAARVIVERLRELILGHLGSLLSTDGAERLLDRWVEADPGGRMSMRTRELADERVRARFVRLLRALAAERIPLTDLDPIVRAFMGATAADTVVLAERTRSLLNVAEQVVDPSAVAEAVPPDIEAEVERWVHEDGERRVLAVPPAVAAQLRREVAQALAKTEHAPLVVLRPGLRPFVRRLVAQLDASRDVLARAELRDVVLLAGETAPLRTDTEVTS